ncbi:MAG: molecular chaperone DnaJ [Comamonadaceae bacterium]|nr:MAG: molecular chaperone DnaJ [Comamonadaceae bacterium]
MEYKDYYATLGVPVDASLDDIKKAYRTLARKHHPDMSKAPDAEAKFKDAAEAYRILKDPQRRAAYDELGRQPAGGSFAPPPEWASGTGFDPEEFRGMDLSDLLDALGRGRGAGHGAARPAHGRDLESTVTVSLEDARHGRTLQLQLEAGVVLEVVVPAGVRQGQKLRLRGKGGKGRNGGADGDMYLHIVFEPHPVFRADQFDLHFDLALTPWEAVLGAEVEVPTLDGPVVLTVAPGTRSGRKLRLRGRGLARDASHKGDLYAHVRIDVPGVPTDRERELFQALATDSTFDPRATAREH